MHGEFEGFAWMGFFPFFVFHAVIMIPFAIGNYFLAGRVGQSRALWVILSIIPFLNYIFFIFVAYVVVLYVLDRLNAMAPGAGAQPSSPA